MKPSSTARRYAEAAFEVARRDGQTDEWVRDLARATEALVQPDAAAFFRTPDVSREDKLAAIDRIFGGMQPQVKNLLRILVSRQRIYLMPAILREFVALKRQAEGIAEAYVTVARPVDDSEEQEISRRLGEMTGKRIEIHTSVDPSILGGIVVRIGDKLIDASVAGRLQRLRQEMAV
ncbi:MAG TPA: F0F1 ATP synthase subunit delta [Chloroflexota bacterium]